MKKVLSKVLLIMFLITVSTHWMTPKQTLQSDPGEQYKQNKDASAVVSGYIG